jgi:DNA-binding IclR family transcriptional regulator
MIDNPEIKNTTPVKTQLKSVNRALQVLEYISENPGRAVDISEGLDISWATLHRTLQQLEQDGFLSKEPSTNRYNVGSRMWFIGSTYIASHPVLEPARPYLNKAAANTSITVQLVELCKKQAMVLFNSSTENMITRAAVGYHFPLHAGSKGQVLLAHSDSEFIKTYISHGLQKLTENTEVDPNRLLSLLAKIRADGYAISIADVQLFSGSVAAPVFNRENKVVASVCFVTRKSTLKDMDKREVLLEQLTETAQSISVSLGWNPIGSRP